MRGLTSRLSMRECAGIDESSMRECAGIDELSMRECTGIDESFMRECTGIDESSIVFIFIFLLTIFPSFGHFIDGEQHIKLSVFGGVETIWN